MNLKLSGWEDTIVALATASGVSAIGVVRVSGPEAISVVSRIFPSRDLAAQPSHTLHYGKLVREGEVLDEVVVSLFRGPSSFTGEDTVEISGHGSPFVLGQIVQACVSGGARPARPGEFTLRAFKNGKLDLTQAESVADLIAAESAVASRHALHHMRGGFSRDLRRIRESLIRFSALIELELDFATEDVEFADRSAFLHMLQETDGEVQELLRSFRLGNVVRQGVSVAIIGKPNAGKSTLLNRLVGEERAIVSDIPGTTRDTIEETLHIQGLLFRLVDTAGIRAQGQDEIENIGIGRSLEQIRKADLVLYLFDVREAASEEVRSQRIEFDKQGIRYLAVANKCDLLPGDAGGISGDQLLISARESRGLEALLQAMFDSVVQDRLAGPDQSVVTNARHVQALQEVAGSLQRIRQGLETGLSGDLLSVDIKACLYHLGEITGEVTSEDKLDYIFSKFCIGK